MAKRRKDPSKTSPAKKATSKRAVAGKVRNKRRISKNSGKADATPTWYSVIRHMFTSEDIAHMGSQGLDLGNYQTVKEHAPKIYGFVSSKQMPPGKPWSDAWVNTFVNWMSAGYPKGTDGSTVSDLPDLEEVPDSNTKATRIRKEISNLNKTELATLVKAFEGVMNLLKKMMSMPTISLHTDIQFFIIQ